MAAVAVAGSPILATSAEAQAAEPLTVMVTNLRPLEDADKDFGRDLAKELRDLIKETPGYQPLEEKVVRDAARQYDIEYDELDCIQSLQMAPLVSARVVFCGQSTENRDDRTFTLSGIQFAEPGGTSFTIDDRTWPRDDAEEAAQAIAQEFNIFLELQRAAIFCGQYFESGDWEASEQNCLRALEMNPDDAPVRFVYANVLKEKGQTDAAYAETQRVMELDPLHEQALQLAGFLAATLGHNEESLEYYKQFLVLNPGNAQVRMRIAYDAAQAGNPEGALLLAEEGLEIEGDNVDLLLQHASFATAVAQNRVADAEPNAPMSMETAELYQKAQQSYQKAYAERGIDMESGHLRNMIAIFKELGQLDEAISMAEQVLETHDDEAQFWSLYADLLNEDGRVDEALAALDETVTRDPAYQNVRGRQGTWLVTAGRADESLPYLTQAIETGERSADDVSRIFFADAVNNGINASPTDLPYALRLLEMARTFEAELSEGAVAPIDFWEAYAIYQGADASYKALDTSNRQASVALANRLMPELRRASRLFALGRVAEYAATISGVQLQQFRDATQQYIEIMERTIQRGS